MLEAMVKKDFGAIDLYGNFLRGMGGWEGLRKRGGYVCDRLIYAIPLPVFTILMYPVQISRRSLRPSRLGWRPQRQ